MSNPQINTKIYDPSILRALDFCNIIQTQRIINTLNGNGVHNLLVLSKLQQKQILGDEKQNIQLLNIKNTSQFQRKVVVQNKKQIQNEQKSLTIQPQSLTNSNTKQTKKELNINNIYNSQTENKNNKTKKKSKKFEKPTNIYKQKNEGQKKKMKFESPYKFQTPCKQKQIYKIQESPQSKRSENQYVSVKELLARQSLMSNIKYHNKSSKNLNQHHIRQFDHSPINYRSLSLSSSPKKVIKVKYCRPPQLFKININEQNFHSNQQSPRVDQSVNVQFVKHRTQFWPFFKNKNRDVIENMQNLKDSKKIKQSQQKVQHNNLNHREQLDLRDKKLKEEKLQQNIPYQKQSQVRTKKQINNKQKRFSPNKQQQQIKKTLRSIQQSKSAYNTKNKQEQLERVNQRKQLTNKVSVQEEAQIKKNRMLEQGKKYNQQQKQKHMVKQLQKLEIKAIGNKYLEKILEKYKQSQMK